MKIIRRGRWLYGGCAWRPVDIIGLEYDFWYGLAEAEDILEPDETPHAPGPSGLLYYVSFRPTGRTDSVWPDSISFGSVSEAMVWASAQLPAPVQWQRLTNAWWRLMATARGRRAFSLAFRPARRGSRQTERFSWNHNSAYYPWVAKAALARQPAVLDVGCGDGSLLAALAPFCCNIIGIDSAPAAVKKAWPRTVAAVNASVVKGDFLAHDFAGKRFHLICFVASLHHMEAKSALDKAKGLLQPGGELRIVALAANGRLGDWLLDMLTWPLARLMGLLKGESQDPAMRTARPTQTHAELRRTVKAMLPGCHVRRGLYYRDLIRWTKPE